MKKCKKHTGNTFPKKLVLISKNKIKCKSKCVICFTKRTFIHEIEDKYDLETEMEVYLDSMIFKTKNYRLTMQSKCANCGIKKSRFMKEQETKGLLSNLGIKIPLSKSPLLNVLF